MRISGGPLARRRPVFDRTAKLAMARLVAAQAEDSAFAEELAECNSLIGFTLKAWPIIEPGTDFLHNWHQDAICEHLEAVTRGEITRLLINMPPRYMKSILVSIMWPCWEWREQPWNRWMFATYAGSLSADHATARRTIVQSEWYRERWGRKVRPTNDLLMDFRNDARGYFLATSFEGSATGRGGNRVVIDDPHNPKKALSDVERVKAVREFNQTFSNRLNNKKRDAIVVVMQRLHEEDVAARCKALEYVHLCLPAESEGRSVILLPSGREIVREDGELLWPEREGPAEIAAAKAAMGSYAYAGQYQQRPAPAGGGMFRREWFAIVKAVPANCRWVRYWDKAGTAGGGAFTAGVLMAQHTDPRTGGRTYYVVDVIRGQWSAGEREKVIRQTAQLDGQHVHVWVEQEPGSGGKESAENTIKNLDGFSAFKEGVTGDKETRARPLSAQAEVGNVKFVDGMSPRKWIEDFVAEAESFPNGRFKDQVDAAGGAFNKLALEPRPGPTAAVGTPKPAKIPGSL